ncbi:hypothetical protein RB195_015372 [Necator americanus]|uniref:Uncharacterized protein n=1 Tax=Necator americanus TaxID=51031 RepID=A0ABR1E490_NECAM
MTAVHITSGSTQDDNDKSSSTRGSVVSRECNTCHHSLVTNADSNNTRFKLKPGENMFDFEGSTASTQSLSSFLHLLAASNVYRMFFAYTQVLQHDTHRCSTAYHKYGHCNRFHYEMGRSKGDAETYAATATTDQPSKSAQSRTNHHKQEHLRRT